MSETDKPKLHFEKQTDGRESFFLAETPKYLYVLFAPPEHRGFAEWSFQQGSTFHSADVVVYVTWITR